VAEASRAGEARRPRISARPKRATSASPSMWSPAAIPPCAPSRRERRSTGPSRKSRSNLC